MEMEWVCKRKEIDWYLVVPNLTTECARAPTLWQREVSNPNTSIIYRCAATWSTLSRRNWPRTQDSLCPLAREWQAWPKISNMSEHFYQPLPSHCNQKELPQNRSNQFTIRLPHPHQLEGSRWKVGLSSVSITDVNINLTRFKEMIIPPWVLVGCWFHPSEPGLSLVAGSLRLSPATLTKIAGYFTHEMTLKV